PPDFTLKTLGEYRLSAVSRAKSGEKYSLIHRLNRSTYLST
ncbi:MAG: hypothetical protein ACI85O_002867, partial [Saprospiraceae bacterium]